MATMRTKKMEKLLERWLRKHNPELELLVVKETPEGRLWRTEVKKVQTGGSVRIDCYWGRTWGRTRRESVRYMLNHVIMTENVSSPEELDLLLESEGF